MGWPLPATQSSASFTSISFLTPLGQLPAWQLQEVVLLTTTLCLTFDHKPGMLSTMYLTQSLKAKSSALAKKSQATQEKFEHYS